MKIDIFQSIPKNLDMPVPNGITGLISYESATKGSLFEFDLFCKVYAERSRSEINCPWGIISSGFSDKTRISTVEFAQFCEREFSSGRDAVFINPFIDLEALFFNVWEQGLFHGEDFSHLFNVCIDEGIFTSHSAMGIDIFCLSNYFVAKPAFWTSYITFANSAIEEICSNPKTRSIAMKTGTYPAKPVAALRVFFMERLFSQFLQQQDTFEISHFPITAERLISKYGTEFGRLFTELSYVKNLAISNKDTALLKEWDLLRIRANALAFNNNLQFKPSQNPALFMNIKH